MVHLVTPSKNVFTVHPSSLIDLYFESLFKNVRPATLLSHRPAVVDDTAEYLLHDYSHS